MLFNAYLNTVPIYIIYDSRSGIKNFLKEFLRVYANGSIYEDKLTPIVDMNLGCTKSL